MRFDVRLLGRNRGFGRAVILTSTFSLFACVHCHSHSPRKWVAIPVFAAGTFFGSYGASTFAASCAKRAARNGRWTRGRNAERWRTVPSRRHRGRGRAAGQAQKSLLVALLKPSVQHRPGRVGFPNFCADALPARAPRRGIPGYRIYPVCPLHAEKNEKNRHSRQDARIISCFFFPPSPRLCEVPRLTGGAPRVFSIMRPPPPSRGLPPLRCAVRMTSQR